MDGDETIVVIITLSKRAGKVELVLFLQLGADASACQTDVSIVKVVCFHAYNIQVFCVYTKSLINVN